MDLNVWFDGQIGELQEAKAQYGADLQVKHDEGYAEGKASIQLPDPNSPDAIYSQAQMNDAVNSGKDEVRGELQPQIDSLKAEVDSLKAVAQDVAAVKAALVEKVKAFKAAGDMSEESLIADIQA